MKSLKKDYVAQYKNKKCFVVAVTTTTPETTAEPSLTTTAGASGKECYSDFIFHIGYCYKNDNSKVNIMNE